MNRIAEQKSNDFSVNLTIPFLKYFGFWIATGREKIFSYIVIVITYVQLIYMISGAVFDVMFMSPDFNVSMRIAGVFCR